ncbi:hypothetical protein [Maridesulfovibrio salexigens]|uniref:RelA/SpoT domain-containing protein n=1 Tax=Maridesulfovibrio salexigens (strain ATCC 14822 / DSM 2638 / NCIMB 8403 / VKM B-1763) TaxID=526222 RepID=C6BVW4_MARSD|nr:hypothetical protein [Maridesulfovibrio salexigens]ACS80167.1 hypothetical protein Desal_2107 [Maridesulfovibrio salexigens DSM 2638]
MKKLKDTTDKPKDIIEYKVWFEKKFDISSTQMENRYEATSKHIRDHFLESHVWSNLVKNYPEYIDEYSTKHSYHLFKDDSPPDIFIKPYESFIEKTYRKNVIQNKNWPLPPDSGWISLEKGFSIIKDIVRTTITVKYLDGVNYIVEKYKELVEECTESNCHIDYEARDEGYYAVHLELREELQLVNSDWETYKCLCSFEVQISTQLQEVLKKLLHNHYEKNRLEAKIDDEWKWNYESSEFSVNYLGHILHYVEGMIMEIRNKQGEN